MSLSLTPCVESFFHIFFYLDCVKQCNTFVFVQDNNIKMTNPKCMWNCHGPDRIVV